MTLASPITSPITKNMKKLRDVWMTHRVRDMWMTHGVRDMWMTFASHVTLPITKNAIPTS